MQLSDPNRGTALIAAIASALVLAGLAASMVTVVHSVNNETRQAQDDLQRFYLAESGARFAQMALVQGDSGSLGSANAPIPLGIGAFWTIATENPDHTIRVVCNGVYGGAEKVLAVTFLDAPAVFDNAVSAGNSSGDPNYVMHFGGTGGHADQVIGDIFSGGDIEFVGDSSISGSVRATGTITGESGESGVSQPTPDLQAMDYENTADVHVAQEFSAGGVLQSNAAGGKAWQLPEDNPAHIFRLNPDDRKTDTGATTKDDYFLEDPYESVQPDLLKNGSNPYRVSVSGSNGNPGVDGNRKVYYIDGNLWIHNLKTNSFQVESDDGLAVTIVVHGNIYISDNMFYKNASADGLALIAMVDPDEPDSGNVYFGDPIFGTLNEMHGYLYAENNFLDNNLNAAGSATVDFHGIMSAGNQVAINRDFGGNHSRLTVEFDDRVSTGALSLPGLPTNSVEGLSLLAWQPAAATH